MCALFAEDQQGVLTRDDAQPVTLKPGKRPECRSDCAPVLRAMTVQRVDELILHGIADLSAEAHARERVDRAHFGRYSQERALIVIISAPSVT